MVCRRERIAVAVRTLRLPGLATVALLSLTLTLGSLVACAPLEQDATSTANGKGETPPGTVRPIAEWEPAYELWVDSRAVKGLSSLNQSVHKKTRNAATSTLEQLEKAKRDVPIALSTVFNSNTEALVYPRDESPFPVETKIGQNTTVGWWMPRDSDDGIIRKIYLDHAAARGVELKDLGFMTMGGAYMNDGQQTCVFSHGRIDRSTQDLVEARLGCSRIVRIGEGGHAPFPGDNALSVPLVGTYTFYLGSHHIDEIAKFIDGKTIAVGTLKRTDGSYRFAIRSEGISEARAKQFAELHQRELDQVAALFDGSYTVKRVPVGLSYGLTTGKTVAAIWYSTANAVIVNSPRARKPKLYVPYYAADDGYRYGDRICVTAVTTKEEMEAAWQPIADTAGYELVAVEAAALACIGGSLHCATANLPVNVEP